MNTGSRQVGITVVCPQRGMLEVLNRIRRWHVDDPLGKSHVHSVAKARDLGEGVRAARECPDASILVPIGYLGSEVTAQLKEAGLGGLETVVRPPRPSRGKEIDEIPSASLLADSHVMNVQNTVPALRKALLRVLFKNLMCVRDLRSEDDFRQYFALRYRVWKHMGYLPAEQDCDRSQWELNFTDRTAYPLGAFTRHGELVGCARLVFPLGQDSYHLRLIQPLVLATDDPKLAENFDYPMRLRHPFDLLESFAGFHAYFMRLVRRRIRYAEVSRVVVAPDYNRRGLGEVIVDSLLALARERQLQVLFLACHARLRGFYERCGFYVLPGLECERFAGVNAPAIAMAIKLTPKGEITLH